MKTIIYAMKDLFRNFFNWRGRLSREGYIWAWAGILIVDVGLFIIKRAVRELVLLLSLSSITGKNTVPRLNYFQGELISEIMSYAITIWNAVIFLPILFATMRRYHDSGKAGWKVILFNGLSLVCIVPGLVIGSVVIIALVFGGGYMITAEADVHMSRLLGPAALSAFLFLAGVGFAIFNLMHIFRKSDPMENAYGKPAPFNPIR